MTLFGYIPTQIKISLIFKLFMTSFTLCYTSLYKLYLKYIQFWWQFDCLSRMQICHLGLISIAQSPCIWVPGQIHILDIVGFLWCVEFCFWVCSVVKWPRSVVCWNTRNTATCLSWMNRTLISFLLPRHRFSLPLRKNSQIHWDTLQK